MSILRFFNQDIVVSRLKDIDSTRRAYSSTATVDGHIQELSPESRNTIGIVEGKAWNAWFREDSPVQTGDILTDSNGVRYSVRECNTRTYGINQHKQCVLIEYNE